MNRVIAFTIPGRPITKKNSMRIRRNRKTGAVFPVPSQQYIDYEARAGAHLPRMEPINQPVNVKCVYYMPTRGRVDLVNLLEATCDILVHYGILKDDNSKIVVGHDGSRVLYDKEEPRVEIEIEKAEVKCIEKQRNLRSLSV